MLKLICLKLVIDHNKVQDKYKQSTNITNIMTLMWTLRKTVFCSALTEFETLTVYQFENFTMCTYIITAIISKDARLKLLSGMISLSILPQEYWQ